MKRIINKSNILFVVALLLGIFISKGKDQYFEYYLILLGLIEASSLLYIAIKGTKEDRQAAEDIAFFIFFIVIIWQLLTNDFRILHELLFPSPGKVVELFISEIPSLLKGLLSSIVLLGEGYIIALILGILLGLLIGWNKRLFRAINPITKVLGPIPPIVYIPYAIAILPTFKSASTFIIFIGAFWPIFMNTLNGVFNIEGKLIESAKALNVGKLTMLFRVMLPSSLPSIITGANIGLIMSFILLTSAEMIGATSGIGWYVKYFSDFADYPRVIVGILFIGIVVTLLSAVTDRIAKYLLKWKK